MKQGSVEWERSSRMSLAMTGWQCWREAYLARWKMSLSRKSLFTCGNFSTSAHTTSILSLLFSMSVFVCVCVCVCVFACVCLMLFKLSTNKHIHTRSAICFYNLLYNEIHPKNVTNTVHYNHPQPPPATTSHPRS